MTPTTSRAEQARRAQQIAAILAALPITREEISNINGHRVWRVTAGTWNVDGQTLFLYEATRKVANQ